MTHKQPIASPAPVANLDMGNHVPNQFVLQPEYARPELRAGALAGGFRFQPMNILDQLPNNTAAYAQYARLQVLAGGFRQPQNMLGGIPGDVKGSIALAQLYASINQATNGGVGEP